jgi:hypothetical protein
MSDDRLQVQRALYSDRAAPQVPAARAFSRLRYAHKFNEGIGNSHYNGRDVCVDSAMTLVATREAHEQDSSFGVIPDMTAEKDTLLSVRYRCSH